MAGKSRDFNGHSDDDFSDRHMSVEKLDRLTAGEVVRGIVVRLVAFGAFIDLGGFEGLLELTPNQTG